MYVYILNMGKEKYAESIEKSLAETFCPVGSNWGLMADGSDEMSEGYLKWKQLAGDNGRLDLAP